MVTHSELSEIIEERRKAEKKNPLLKLNLGELVQEMNKLCVLDSNVVKPKKDLPEESLGKYNKYQRIIKELKRREKEYQSYKPPHSL